MLKEREKIKHTDRSTAYRRVLSARSLASDDVKDAEGQKLGTIDEIMIDIPSGRVAYAVMSFGGFLGMGDKLFAVPWSALQLDEDEKCFVLDVDRNVLERAPGFNKNRWPDMADPSWGTQVYRHYGVQPYWE